MNKTVNINLGGMFFYIDEDAYQKLSRYFEAIKRSLSNANSQDEIINDIESRIAELINGKHTSPKQVISIKEIDEVIAIMGQPEDYRIEGESETNTGFLNNETSIQKTKKLYRDKDGAAIGGVLSGLGYYFGIDRTLLRIVALVLLLVFGIGVLMYIILWIVMPQAITTTEKLEMRGEPVTISNIEKKVRQEFDNVAQSLKNTNFDDFGNRVKSNTTKFGSTFGDFLIQLFQIFGKLLGGFIIVVCFPVILLLFIGIFTLGSTTYINFPWTKYIDAGNYANFPAWSYGLLIFITIGIPFFWMLMLGFRLLIPTIKTMGSIAKYTLLAVWLIAIAALIALGVQQVAAFAQTGKTTQKEVINLKPTDTLFVKFRFNDFYSKNISQHENFNITQDASNHEVIYSNEIQFSVEKTEQSLPYLVINKTAQGSSLFESKQMSEKIKYGFEIQKNTLLLDNYWLTDLTNKFRDQEVEVILYLPKNTLFKADKSVQEFDQSNNDFFNLHYSSGDYTYRVGDLQIKCENCPIEENDFGDIEVNDDSTQTNISIKQKKQHNHFDYQNQNSNH